MLFENVSWLKKSIDLTH